MPTDTPEFTNIWVIGLGATGAALTALLARHGHRVMGVEQDPTSLRHGRDRVRRAAQLATPQGADVRTTLDNVGYTIQLDLVRSADLVIEAVPDSLAAKTEVLRLAHELCGPDTVFVTTTLGLSVTELAAGSGRMSRVVGLQVGDPERTVTGGGFELVRTPVTEDSVYLAVRELVRGTGRTAVRVGDRPGALGGALLLAYLNNAAATYERGYASRDDIDAAMTLGCGLPVGPLAQLDLMGLDSVHDSLVAVHRQTGDKDYEPTPLLSRMVRAGLLGRKSGRGFYRYDGDTPVPELGVDRRPLPQGRPIGRIGIVGSGTMASGIAEVCARAGYPVLLAARTETKAKEALSTVDRSLDRGVRRGKLTAEELTEAMGRLEGTSDLSALADCDLVVEAVVEDIEVKRAVFAELDRRTRPSAILATTTSSLPVIQCATATSRPENVIGMHFFNPAPVMRLVEVVRTFLTSEEVAGTAHALATSLRRHPVHCTDRAGFIVNALLFPYLNRAVNLAAERHVATEDVDTVMSLGHGYPMGPFQLLDVIGIDVSLAIQNRLHEAFGDPALAPARYLVDLVQAGLLGRKTGRGFRVYD
ncbi:3-hydroxybutyryl-CoA dehydrogenase [Kutzneria viridogrisea]|uniref:3-hydroxybutyryl-CoA dehydrogenase n=2 Tax=Kutzneria TaxID=43356 RepID=W5WH39_9PSEU|nr:3-hydroxyacyl-CoA dehydrogenase [Kutzneria albida]AHH99911.1 hypothetical protein KALB_6552 [Kutzneria albida DSM 43870]MBA8925092.1 3-hydroxybutyryl-CoA dehydrogenase [Kutzneria viridogrisea]